MQTNFSWLKQVDKNLLKLNEIPLLKIKPFDFKELSSAIANKFEIDSFEITSKKIQISSFQDAIKNFKDYTYLSFSSNDLNGDVFLLISNDDLNILINNLISNKEKEFQTPILKEGFYRYFILNVLNNIKQMEIFEDLSLNLVEKDLVKEDLFLLDLNIEINDQKVFPRLLITNDFRKSFVSYFINTAPMYARKVSKSLMLTLNAKIAHVDLSYDDFKKIKPNDFVILDRSTYDIEHNKGKATLMLENLPIFQAKISKNKIKILDFANYFEENKTMKEEDIDKLEEDISNEEIVEVDDQEENVNPLQSLPVTLTVEAARFKISLDKLMNMQPGNILDLAVHPEQGVDLSVNGQKIGRAELVNLGETLGIRIIEMG
jgi:flagellar motor switch protein FliN/FliY